MGFPFLGAMSGIGASGFGSTGIRGGLRGILSPIGEIRTGIKMGLDPVWAEQVDARNQYAQDRSAYQAEMSKYRA